MKNKLLKTMIFLCIIIFYISMYISMYTINPTKTEIDRYFEENKCNYCSGEVYGKVYHMRRTTAMLWGQVFEIPVWWIFPNFMLYTTTPFNYYHDINHGEDEFHTFTWIDTTEGRFVYNVLTGECIKEIDENENPNKKYHEDMDREVNKLKNR